MISTLKRMTKIVTTKNDLWLCEESFKLVGASFSIKSEFLRIDLTKFSEDMFSLSVYDEKLQKYVSLSFNFSDDNLIFVYVLSKKIRNLLNFWKKQYFSYEVSKENEKKDENIKFVWDRIPEYLINLK